ncbi:hypothetical protein ACGFRG_00565 [Streptomyces sp. NPDC048696]|uniref:hypothetical protein n=1 Tax=Streptomyces sp. NPDC048696 TaxID=3365585 RepID=UPI003714FC20
MAPPVPVTPRKLNSDERAVLEKVLSARFPGADGLKAQLDACEVVAQWAEDSVSVDIQPTPAAVPAADAVNGPAPAVAVVQGLPGDDLLLEGEILVWVAGGYLSGIEYAWFGDAMPTRLPSADRITIEVE